MSPSIHRYRLWFRIASLIIGAACFLWLSIEDNNLIGVFIFGLLFSGLLAIQLAYSRNEVGWITRCRSVIAGFLGGIFTPIIALTLMILKNGLHLHTVPEYTSVQLLTVIRSAPIWVLVGAIAGFGWKLLHK